MNIGAICANKIYKALQNTSNMAKIILISCVSKKLDHKARAKDLYISSLFKYNLDYARSLNPNQIFILSAKYGLLGLEEEIEPYDTTLNNMKVQQRREWAQKVLGQLEQIVSLGKDEFIFLAGKKYREYLIPHISNYDVPMQGLGIGKQLKFLKEHVK
jgi:hypothetical protein